MSLSKGVAAAQAHTVLWRNIVLKDSVFPASSLGQLPPGLRGQNYVGLFSETREIFVISVAL